MAMPLIVVLVRYNSFPLECRMVFPVVGAGTHIFLQVISCPAEIVCSPWVSYAHVIKASGMALDNNIETAWTVHVSAKSSEPDEFSVACLFSRSQEDGVGDIVGYSKTIDLIAATMGNFKPSAHFITVVNKTETSTLSPAWIHGVGNYVSGPRMQLSWDPVLITVFNLGCPTYQVL